MTHEIKTANYIGYLWKSDQQKPEVLRGDKEFCTSLNDGENPFVIEGNLWDPASMISTTIKFVDGRYIVKTCTLTDEDLSELRSQIVNYSSDFEPREFSTVYDFKNSLDLFKITHKNIWNIISKIHQELDRLIS